MKNEIVLFKTADGAFSMPVRFGEKSAWLTRQQMADLFQKDRTVIGRHIQNAIDCGEIDPATMCAKFAHMGENTSQVYKTDIYNLEVVISVGYRVNSMRGVEFRRWATQVLMEYIEKGYAINRKRLQQLHQAVEVMKRISNSLDTDQILEVVNSYSAALDLLDDYDHQTIAKPNAKSQSVELTYEECCEFIDRMKFNN